MMKMKLGAFAAVVLFSLGSLAEAQQNVRISQDGRPERLFRPAVGLNAIDRKAMDTAAITNMFEIKAGEMAQRRGQAAWVKQYGKEMVREHSLAHEELKLIALDKGVELPGGISRDKQAHLDRLGRLNGAAFDREYRRLMLMSHGQTSNHYQTFIKNGRDEDVKSYVVTALPAVKMHYRLAMMQRTMMGGTKLNSNL